MSLHDYIKGPAWPLEGAALLASTTRVSEDLVNTLRARTVSHAASACEASGLSDIASAVRMLDLSDRANASDALFALYRSIPTRQHRAQSAVWDAAIALTHVPVSGIVSLCISAARDADGARSGQYDTMRACVEEDAALARMIAGHVVRAA